MITFICYSRCSTCQRAKKYLESINVEFIERDIADDNPTFKELSKWYQTSNLPLKKFFNTSGLLYKGLCLKDKLPTMSDDEQLKLLSTNGMLVKRPILLVDDKVLVGFNEEEWEKVL